MGMVEAVHQHWGAGRRARALAGHVAAHLPAARRVLDVGVGSGRIARLVRHARPELSVVGVDVLYRWRPLVATALFDGLRLPFRDVSFDAAMVVDVLHHAADPGALLREVVRVSPAAILVKDHLREGLGAQVTLAFMDRVGNRRFKVASPGNYLDRGEWLALLQDVGLEIQYWDEDLRIYPRPLDWIFGRSLHFVAVLCSR